MKVVFPPPHHIYILHKVSKILKHKWNSFCNTKLKYQSYSRLNILLENSFESINSNLSWKFGKFSRKKTFNAIRFHGSYSTSVLTLTSFPCLGAEFDSVKQRCFIFREFIFRNTWALDFCSLAILVFWRL